MNAGMTDSEALRAVSMSARKTRVRANGIEVQWREWGNGKPLVLVHGGHGSWMHWARNIEQLSQHYRVLAPDMPGFGESEDFHLHPHDPARLEALLSALDESITSLVGQESFHLAGFSFGGAISGLLAGRLSHLDKLVLLGTGGHGGARREIAPQLNWRVPDPEERARALRQNLAVFMLSGEHAIDDDAVRIHTASCEATRFRSKGISRVAWLPEALSSFSKPIFFLWGDADVTAVPEDAIRLLQQGKTERDWKIFPNAGHWVQYEASDAVNTSMIEWLAKTVP